MKWFGSKDKRSVWSSRTKLAVGAAGLLLFIVGVKRNYQLEDASGTVLNDHDGGTDAQSAAPAGEPERR